MYIYQGNLVDGFTRYKCVSGHCKSYQAATNTEGYATVEECATATGCIGQGTRYYCTNCAAAVADAPLDEGYASQAECEASCPPEGGFWLCYGGACAQDLHAAHGYRSEAECHADCGFDFRLPHTVCITGLDGVTAYDGNYTFDPLSYPFNNAYRSGSRSLFANPVSAVGSWGVKIGDPSGEADFLGGHAVGSGNLSDSGDPTDNYTIGGDGAPTVLVVSAGPCAGRYVCSDGTCTLDPTAVAPTGFATLDECLESCAAGADCALGGSLSFATVAGIQKRVTAVASGAVGTPTYAFSSPSSGIPNATANTCLVNVAAGETLLVTCVITAGDCSVTRSLTVRGDSDSGASACSLAVGLTLLDEGGGHYKVTAALSGVTGSSPTVSFFLDGVPLSPDSGMPLTASVQVDYGDSKTLVAVGKDGTCAAGEVLGISNGDGGAATPEVPFGDDCVARLGIYYRDFQSETAQADAVIWNARIGLEVRPPCSNPACAYWWQLFDSSDASLFEVYTDEALQAHFPVVWEKGQRESAAGKRIERYQVLASAISRPATQHKHFRLKATPVYQQHAFALSGNTVKIRDLQERSLLLFETGPAKISQWTAPDAGTYGYGTVTTLVDLTTRDASDATDAAVLDDKAYVIAPGEIFVVDMNSGEATLNSGVRGETRTAKFVEVVGGKPLVVYVDNAATPKSRCYDLSFPTPKLVWEASYLVTGTQVADGRLLLAAGNSLYLSPSGTATPVLDHTFGSIIQTLASGYVGLADAHLWKKKSTGWAAVESLAGPVGAVWPWYGGAEVTRALAGAASGSGANRLRAEQPTLNWADDITLTGATGVKAMRSLEAQVTPATETTPAINDEWMLIGDDAGQLWVYSRSAISEKDGAFQACSVAVPRLFPFLRRASTS